MASKDSVNIKPLAGYVLIEPVEANEKTLSGLYLPESAQEKQGQGKVISVGDPIYIDGKEVASPVKVGEVVYYKKWGGDEIKLNNKELKIVKFDDLMAILEK